MRFNLVLLILIALALPVPSHAATEPPKPLLAEPTPADKKKVEDPDAWPQSFTDDRHKNRDDYNALIKEYDGIDAECEKARTPVEHAACDNRKRLWQTKMDALHARMDNLHRRIDMWRHKQAGLPPPEWWPQPQPQKGQPGYVPPKPPMEPVLVPQSSPLPTNTY